MLRLDDARPDSTRRKLPIRCGLNFFTLLTLALVASCDFVDPTDVENPRTTTEDLAQTAAPTNALLPGMRVQFARAVAGTTVLFELVSDNYSVHGTGLDSELDNLSAIRPNLVNGTGSATGAYWNFQELRALGDFILDEIAPEDTTATNAQLGEIHYFRGMAYLLQGENYTAVPVEADGSPLPASELLQRAVSDFETSISLAGSGEFATRSRAALARAHRLLGNETEAGSYAQDALGDEADFVFLQGFDEQSLNNQAHIFLVVRELKEMQPLPRLDFLDPKYLSRDAGVPVAKAEEMHLILAEIELAGGDEIAARGHLVDALSLAGTRPSQDFDDDDQRLNGDLTPRPSSGSMLVRADEDSPFREGLVLDRPGVISSPLISATSLDPDSIATLTDEDDIWHAFHLARQEIMFLEGRRMSDLGIRLPMMLREIDANPNISPGGPGTEIVVPAYVPSGTQMDSFSPSSPYDDEGEIVTNEITVLHDMNRILAEQRVSPFNPLD